VPIFPYTKANLRDGAKLAYVDQGNHHPLVMLHGFSGTAHRHLDTLIDEFRSEYRVLAPDLRGYGASQPPGRDFPPQFIERDADDVAELLDALGCSRSVVLGFSDGGESGLVLGSPDELPGMKLKKAYEEGLAKLPDWRITCFFVDREYRHKGVASAALNGALQEIARLGGGTVESYPEEVEGRSTSGSFLYNATLAMFERRGFHRVRRLGKTHWVVTRTVRKAAKTVGGKRSSAA
jgi:GNAT superfamily N-acetyltransferase